MIQTPVIDGGRGPSARIFLLPSGTARHLPDNLPIAVNGGDDRLVIGIASGVNASFGYGDTGIAEPNAFPVTTGSTRGNWEPPGTKTLDVTVAVLTSSLSSRTYTPPAGAGTDKLKGNDTESSGATSTASAKSILASVTSIVVVAGLKPVAVAVSIVVPG